MLLCQCQCLVGSPGSTTSKPFETTLKMTTKHIQSMIFVAAMAAGPGLTQGALIHDFDDQSLGPLIASAGGTTTIIPGTGGPTDYAAQVEDAGGGFTAVLNIDGEALLQELHANTTITWDIESAVWSGGFNNNHVVFQSNLPGALGGFNTLANSALGFYPSGTTNRTYTYNYDNQNGNVAGGTGEGRQILNALDGDKDGVIDPGSGATFFNVFIIQQTGGGESSTFVYDNIALIPEPSGALLMLLGMSCAMKFRRRR